MPKLEIDHVSRPALPWRTEVELTECGRPVEDYEGRLITSAELATRIKDLGKQRAAMITCMTCLETFNRWASALNDPITVTQRELQQVAHRAYEGPVENLRPDVAERYVEHRERREKISRELQAIALLIDAHRSEFEELIEDLASTVSIQRGRKRKRTETRVWRG